MKGARLIEATHVEKSEKRKAQKKEKELNCVTAKNTAPWRKLERLFVFHVKKREKD